MSVGGVGCGRVDWNRVQREAEQMQADAPEAVQQSSSIAGLSSGASGNSVEASSGQNSATKASYASAGTLTGASRVHRQINQASSKCTII